MKKQAEVITKGKQYKIIFDGVFTTAEDVWHLFRYYENRGYTYNQNLDLTITDQK